MHPEQYDTVLPVEAIENRTSQITMPQRSYIKQKISILPGTKVWPVIMVECNCRIVTFLETPSLELEFTTERLLIYKANEVYGIILATGALAIFPVEWEFADNAPVIFGYPAVGFVVHETNVRYV